MNPFRYIIGPLGTNFTSRAALRTALPAGNYLDTLATRSGLTRAQVEAFITAQVAYDIELARQGIPVDTLLGKYRLQPSCGGSFTTPDPDAQLIRDTLSMSYIYSPETIDALRHDCPVEKSGEVGAIAPTITSVRGRPGNTVSAYGVGTTKGCEVNGNHFRDRRAEAVWPTAELVDGSGGSPIALAVLDATPTRLVLGGAPAGTTGLRYLKVIDANGRFGIYDVALSPI